MKPYGTLQLTDASPAQEFTEPISVSEVVNYLSESLDWRGNDKTELIESLITAARDYAEYLQGRDLVVKQYDLRLDSFACPEIELRAPLQAVQLINYIDSDGNTTALVEDTDYIVDTSRSLVMPAYGLSWPSFTEHPSSAVLVRFTAGYPTAHPFWLNAGRSIKQGMMLLIAGWYTNRIPYVTGATASTELPFAVTALLGAGAVRRVR